MISKIEKYKNEANIHRTALLKLPEKSSLPPEKKKELSAAYKYGKRLGMALQVPFAVFAVYFYSKIVPKLTKEGKILSYTIGLCCCNPIYSLTKAWGWHKAYERAEPIVKEYILDPNFKDY